MDWKEIGIAVLVLALFFLIHYIRSRLYRDPEDKGPEMTGHATVASRRVEQGRSATLSFTRWNYLVTFALEDGEKIELYTLESDYRALKEGLSGQLTWQGKRFYHFDPDIPE